MRISDHAKARIDWPLALRPGKLAAPPFRVYAVARERNEGSLRALAGQAEGRLVLRSLDEGHGRKFDLVDAMAREQPPDPDEWLVVADDDIRLVRGDLARFVAIADAAGFDLAQPALDRRGKVTSGITVSRPLTRARLTSFVEFGPVFAIRPAVRDVVTATFAGSGLGWGLRRVWHSLEPPLRLGIVDEVRVLRRNAPDDEAEAAEARLEMYRTWERHGLVDGQQPEYTYRSWRAWQRIP